MSGYGYAAEAIVKVGADTAQAEQGLTTVSGKINALGGISHSAGQAINRGLTVGATAIAGIAAVSIGAAAEFDQQMRNINSIAQLSQEGFEDLRSEMLDFSLTTRSGPEGVADAMYMVVSAGMSLDETMGTVIFRGKEMSEGMAVLQAATSAAGAGLAQPEETIKLLISALGAYNLEASEAGRVTDIFLHTVNEGLTTLPALAGSLGRILPTAANLGIGLDEVGFALSQMTKTGLSTEEATTRLNAVMTALLKPSEAMKEVLGALGVTSGTQLVKDFGGLMGAIKALTKTEFENTLVTGGMNDAQVKMAEDLPYMRRELALANEELAKMTAAEKPNYTAIERKRISIEKLTDKIGKYESSLAGVLPVTERVTKTTYGSNEALAEMFGNVRSLGGALAIMSDDATLSAEALEEFSKAADGALERMRAEQYKSFNAQMGLLKSSLKVIAIEIGTRLLPALTGFVTAIRTFVQQYGPPMIDWLDRVIEGFEKLSEPVRTIVGLFGGLFIASRSLNTVLRVAAPMLGMMGISIGTIGAPILALIGVVGTLAAAWKGNWGGIKDYITNEIAPGLKSAIGGIKQMLAGIWEGLTTGDWEGVKQKIKYGWLMAIDGAREAFEGARDGIVFWASNLWQRVVDWWTEGGGQEWAQGVAAGIRAALASVPGLLVDAAEGAKVWLVNTWGAIRTWWDEGGQEWAQGVADSIKGALANVPGLLSDATEGAKTWLVNTWGAIRKWWDEGGQEWAQGVADSIKGALAKVPGLLVDAAGGAKTWLVDTWTNTRKWWDENGQEWAQGVADSIGGALASIPGLLLSSGTDASQWLAPLWEGMEELTPVVDILEAVFLDLVTAADNFVASMGPVGEEIKELTAATGELLVVLAPAGKLVAGAGLVIGVVFGELIAGFLNNVGIVLRGFLQYVTGAVQVVTGTLESFKAMIKLIFEGDIPGATEIARGAFVTLVTGVSNLFAGLGNMIIGVFGLIYDTVAGTLSKLPGVTVPLWAEVTNGFQITTDGAREWASGVIGATDQVATSAGSNAAIVSSAFGDMAGAARTTGDEISQSLSGIEETVDKPRRETEGWLQRWIASFSETSDTAVGTVDTTKTDLDTALSGVEDTVNKPRSETEGWLQKWVTGFSKSSEDAVVAIEAANTGIAESVLGVSGSVTESATTIQTDLETLLSNWNTTFTEMETSAAIVSTETIPSVSVSVTESTTAIQTDLETLLSNWNTTFTEMETSAAIVSTETIPSVSASVTESTTAIQTDLETLLSNWNTTFTEMETSATISSANVKSEIRNTYAVDLPQTFSTFHYLAVGETIKTWQGVLGAMRSHLQLIKSDAATMMGSVASGLASARGAFAAAGADLMAGLQGGIMSQAGAIAAAAAAVVSAAIAAARAAGNMRSPSRVMQEVGWDWVLGFIQGIEDQEPEAIKAATDLISAVAGAASSIVNALADLSGYRFALIDFASLNRQIKAVVANFKLLADFFASPSSGLASAGTVLDPLGEVFSKLNSILAPLRSLAEDPLPDDLLETITGAMRALSGALPEIVRALAALSGVINYTDTVKAAMIGEAISSIVGSVASAVDGLAGLPRFILPLDVPSLIARVVETVRIMVNGLLTISTEIDRLRQAVEIGDLMSSIVAPWQAILKALAALAEYQEVSLEGQIVHVVSQLSAMTWAMAQFNEMNNLAAAAKLGDMASSVVAPWLAMLKALAALAEYQVVPLEGQIVHVISQLSAMTWAMGQFNEMGNLTAAAELGDMASSVVDPWLALLKTLDALAEYQVVPLEGQIVHVISQLSAMTWAMGQFNEMNNLAVAAELGDMASSVVDPWMLLLETLAALAEYRPVNLEGQIVHVVSQLSAMTWAMGQFNEMGNTGAAAELGDLASRIIDPWMALIETLEAMSGLVIRDASVAIAGLAGFLEELTRAILSLADPAGTGLSEELLEKAAKMAGLLSDVLAPWEKAIALAEDLRMFKLMPDFVERMVRFGRQWIEVVDQLGRIILTLESEGLDAVREFSTALGALIDGLQVAMDLVLADEWPEPSPEMWDGFVGWVWGVFQVFYDKVQELTLDPDNVIDFTPVTEFAAALESLLNTLNTALDVARNFEFEQPDAELWDAFVNWVWDIFRFFYDKVQELILDPANVIDFEPVAIFAAALESILNALNLALDIARNFDFEQPNAELWDNFRHWVWQIFEFFYAHVQALIDDPASVIDFEPVAIFASALESILSSLNLALDIARNFDFEQPNAELWDNFRHWVWQIFEFFYAHVQALINDPASVIDFAPVTEFATALESILNALNTALDVARNFDFEQPNAELWNNFLHWVWQIFEFFFAHVQALINDPASVIDFVPVTEFATALDSLLNALNTALDVARDFDFEQPDPELWNAFVNWVWDIFHFFYLKVQELMTDPANVIDFTPVLEFATALDSLLNALNTALDVARNFDFEQPDVTLWDAFLNWVWDIFRFFYNKVQELMLDPDNVIGFTPVLEFATALDSLLNALNTALDVARNFDFVEPDPTIWQSFIDWVWDTFHFFYLKVNELMTDPDNVIDFTPVTEFGNALTSLMTGLHAALELARGFRFTPPPAEQWDNFIDWVIETFQIFWEYIQTLETDPEEAINFDPMASFGNALSAIMGGLAATIELITNFVWVAPNPDIWDNFITWVMGFMTDLRERILTEFPATPEGAATFAPVADFGTALSAVMGGLEAALEFLEGLADYIAPADDLVNIFLDDVLEIVEYIGEYVLENIDPAQLIAVSRFSDALDDLTSGLSSALSLFEGLANLSDSQIDWLTNAGAGTGTNTGTAMQIIGYLFMAIVETLRRFHTEVVNNAGPNWIPAAQAFYNAMSDVFDLLQSALNLFTDLGQSGMPSTAVIEAFVGSIMQVFTAFNTGLASVLPELATTITDIREELHVRLYGYFAWQAIPQPNHLYFDLGVNIVGSIGAGMLSQTNYIYQVAYDIGQTILAGLNASLGIASPSAAGLYAGAMTGEGLALGILGSVSQVRSAAKSAADAAIDELGKASDWQSSTPTPLWPDMRSAAPGMAPTATVEHVFVIKVDGGDKLPKMNDIEMREFARELGRHVRLGG